MTRILLSILLVQLSLLSESQQLCLPDPLSGQDRLITYGIGINQSIHHEIRFERFVHEKWSLIHTIGLSESTTRGYSDVRLPIGPSIGAGLIIGAAYCSISDIFYWGDFDIVRLACLVPDGISYHKELANGFYFSPYVNWSGLTVRYFEETDHAEFIYTPKVGIRLLKPIGKHGLISAEQTIQREYNNKIQIYPSVGISARF